ncbi:metal ABC transporter substrate-binding protein [Stackebrandtia nassauensis]|uniref:Periplasmic solute binding protein n=1 Tax=Stackebrandtia nassauensis (strain DSM 44728 / CIP 108903 / NRRL B-16338 / NBRC 102104 / LLR-40K-21) TaxID=446470 RepID=D3Q0K6_STANL|nr:metal ABC transporter substrate-binding protein [Stackebrandtia nassauensis]ADD41742.1 periplasmic solute binding protein [Stackebrandtia nassauensis DSM 44728]
MRKPLPRLAVLSVATALTTATLSACGSAGAQGSGVNVVASFYPLQFVSEQVGGEHVTVTNLTAAGAEPHDLELKPRQVADITDAQLVVFLKGFQPAVDDAVKEQAPDTSLDVAKTTELTKPEEGHEEHAEEGDHEHDHGDLDPHVWLDPTKLAEIADGVADRLAKADPDHAEDFKANAKSLGEKLTDLDSEYDDGLAKCDSRDLVTSHAAFGYLAARYDLHQVAMSGLTPESEPGSGAMKQIMDYVEEHGVTTIYYETLVSPDVAETIADKTGAKTAVLDPIEGLQKGSEDDYFSIMESNLSALREGLGCQ